MEPPELLILDLPAERILAREMVISRKTPDHVVGQAGEHPRVIAPPPPLEVCFDRVLA
ncbi:MAG: hypothetical protein H0W23_07490 [Chloroflexia bacterium]|nr:hypothetical protein [Chloroflexia bacterium]